VGGKSNTLRLVKVFIWETTAMGFYFSMQKK